MNSTTPTATTEPRKYEDPTDEYLREYSPEMAVAVALKMMEDNESYRTRTTLKELAAIVATQCQEVADGDLSHVKRTLSCQVKMLERLVDHLFHRAMGMGPVVDVYERYLRLAMRAQAQLVRTSALLKQFNDPPKATESPATKGQQKQPQQPPPSTKPSLRVPLRKLGARRWLQVYAGAAGPERRA